MSKDSSVIVIPHTGEVFYFWNWLKILPFFDVQVLLDGLLFCCFCWFSIKLVIDMKFTETSQDNFVSPASYCVLSYFLLCILAKLHTRYCFSTFLIQMVCFWDITKKKVKIKNFLENIYHSNAQNWVNQQLRRVFHLAWGSTFNTSGP